jgi:hypothetical protein
MQQNEKLSPVVACGILVTITIGIMIFILQMSREYPQYNAERIRLRNSLNDSQYDVEVNGIKYKVREYCIRSHTEYSGGYRWWNRSSKTICDEYATDSIRVNTHHTYKN